LTRLQHHPTGVELLDSPESCDEAVRQSLANIARANRWFGGTWAVRWALRRALPGIAPETELLLLDVGAGAGDLALDAERVARASGHALRALCLDRHHTAALMAAVNRLPALEGDAGQLPFRSHSVDIVVLSQLLHHFNADSAAQVLREAARVARRYVLVADLRRSAVAALAFRFGARMLGFDRITAADGLTSIQRGFHPAEIASLLARAGLAATVHRRPGWRLVAVASAAAPS
jgi:SAM-dependent methyltransferase